MSTDTNTNPEIEAILDELSDMVCTLVNDDDLSSEDGQFDSRKGDLLKSLVTNGYGSKEGRSLAAEIESRVKSKCMDGAMHRGGRLSSITSELSDDLREISQWESRQPSTRSEPKAANISSATDA